MKGTQSSLVGVIVVLAVIAVAASWYAWSAKSTLTTKTAEYETQLADVTNQLAEAEAQNTALGGNLEAEKARNDAFANQINDISGTVGKLDKLSKTDPELLKKYSKVYFLNENYVPTGTIVIDKEFTYGEEESVHEKVYPFLKDMLEAAKDDGVDLEVISGYRSFGTQAALKSSYKVTYGTGANAFSADQGYSEHQLGTAVDFTTNAIGASFTGFEKSKAYTWLQDNAYKYGFILSYPSGNTYYQYEPWHWRFVSTDLARDLHKKDLNFYDMDQREIDSYLINFFD